MLEGMWGGTLVIGMGIALWNKIKLLSWKLFSLVIVRARVEGEVGNALAYYCFSRFKKSPFGEKTFSSDTDYVRALERYQIIGFEYLGWDSTVFWYGWKPLLMGLSTNAIEGGGNTGSSIYITFVRGMFNLEALIIEALDLLNKVKHCGDNGSRFFVKRVFGYGPAAKGILNRNAGENKPTYASERPESGSVSYARRYLKWDKSELGMAKNGNDSYAHLAFPPEVVKVAERCKRWLLSKNWYKEKEIDWRLGVCLYGIPGTGKSSLIKAIGRDLDLPIISFDLASFSNKDFETEWQNMLGSSPCIALIEDLDSVFHGRDNKLGENGGGLTFDCLLNCIGGVKNSDGVVVFITTNKLECLDEALGKNDNDRAISTRPGRIDLVIELKELDKECRLRIAQRILSDCPEHIESLVEQGEGDTGAQFVERCSRVALDHYWEDKRVPTNRLPTKGSNSYYPVRITHQNGVNEVTV